MRFFVCLFFMGAGEVGGGAQMLKIIVRVHSFNLHILRISKFLSTEQHKTSARDQLAISREISSHY